MHPAIAQLLCCCPCYPKWLTEVDSSGEPVLDSSGDPIVLYSALNGANTWGASTYPFNTGPIPEFIRVRIRAPEGAPPSKLDNRVFDVRYASGETLHAGESLTPGSLICGQQLTYTGCFTIDDDIELIDGSGTVHVNLLRITLNWSVQDWGFGDCGSPLPVLTTVITAETDESGGGGYAFAGNAREAPAIMRTSIGDGIINNVSAFVGWPPSPGVVIFWPALFDPAVPILVSPKAPGSSGNAPNGEYLYPTRNRWLELTCSPRVRATEACDYEPPPSYATSSGAPPESSGAGSSGGGSGGSSGGGSGGSSGGSSGGGGTEIYLEARVCGTNELSGKFYEFVGVDEGTVWKQPDGTCLWADLQTLEATATSTPAVDMTDPQVSCAACYGEALCFFANGTNRRTLINTVLGRFTAEINLFDGSNPSVFNGTHELQYMPGVAPPGYGSPPNCQAWTFGKTITVPDVSKIELRLYATGIYFGATRWYLTGRHYVWDVAYYDFNPETEEFDIPVNDWVEQPELFQFGNESYLLIFGASNDEFPSTIDPTYVGSNGYYQQPDGNLAYVGSAPSGHGIEVELDPGPTDGLDLCEPCDPE